MADIGTTREVGGSTRRIEGVADPLPPLVTHRRVAIVAPSPPPYGGMALQARLLEKLLRCEHSVSFFPSNLPFPPPLRFLERLRGVRPFFRLILFSVKFRDIAANADVIHIFAASWLYFFFVVSPAVLIGRRLGKTVILNYRGGEAARFFRWFGWAASPILKMASAVTAPSAFLAQVIGNRFDLTVQIVPNIIDLSCFRYRERAEIRPKMVVARHLEKSYDIESVLKAFRKVQEHHPEASLRIAGTGSQEAYLRRLVSIWNLKNIQFLGRVAHQDLPRLYDDCDILMNASLIDNFPGTLVEASSAGLVVVTTSAGGIPFLYEDDKNGLLAQPGDWKGLARAVERLLAEPSLAHRLARNASNLTAAFDWKHVRQSLYRSYGFLKTDLQGNPEPYEGQAVLAETNER